ncbi:ABC transporter permease [Amycolatopsis sp. GM8]|uniref:ABC transporter permease n=1 Tax=Amycolatopsis sp. GM8 TaxID=2896530 RepID=UPI001F3D462D|nr:ABC transporter permease [Amycolatopsis sp. GM8]
MTRFIAGRLLAAVPLLVGISLVIFVLMQVLPGNEVASILPPGAGPEETAALRHSLGLDQSLPLRFWTWLTNLFTGNLGYSAVQQRTVSSLIAAAWLNTAILALCTAAFGILSGVALGVTAAYHRGKWIDRLLSGVSLTGLSVPSFWLAIVLLGIFGATLRLLPTQGTGLGDGAGSFILHLIMPMVAGGLVTQGLTAKVARAAMIEALDAEYVETLRAKGLRVPRILWHAFKNSLNPVLATSGLQLGYLLGGQVLIETIFSWPGMGKLVYAAIGARDLQTVQGAMLVIAATFVVLNLVVDIVQAAVNPVLRGSHG